jgi:hypothetical protein
MKHLCTILSIAFALFCSSAYAEIYTQVRIGYPDVETVQKILQAGFEPIFAETGQYVDFAIGDFERGEFDALGIPYDIIHEDMAAFYRSRNPLGLTMGGFKTYAEIEAAMDTFSSTYTNLCSPKYSIGTTGEGRSLWAIRISDNVLYDDDEPEVLVTGLHHAREPIGSEICVEFMRFLLTNYGTDPVATNLVNNYEVFFVPVVNPDGYEYNRQTDPNGGGMWRKNRRNNGDGSYGIDLNRNYAYFWGYDNNGSSGDGFDETYRGQSPASEPEISALQAFEGQHDFAIIVNYHSYGNYFLHPWGFYNGQADEVAYYDTLSAYATTRGYSAGTPWELLYSVNGESTDWCYGENRLRNRSFATVIEVGSGGDGFWPNQSRIAPLVNENIDILKDLLPRANYIYERRLPRKPAITSPAEQVPNNQFYLHWNRSPLDTFNLAVSYRVTQKSGRTRAIESFEATTGYDLVGFARSNTRSHSGTYSIYSGQGSNYRRHITLAERLKVQAGDTLTFWTWYNIQNGFDYAYVMVSTDGGVHWLEINGNLSTTQNPNRRNRGFGITGSSGGSWVRGVYPINSYVGQEIKIRFYYWTDGSTNNEGIYIDDIYPTDHFTSSTVIAETVYAESLLVGPYSSGYFTFAVESRDDMGHIGPPSDKFQIAIIGNRYALSGHVALSDNPPDLSGAIISIPALALADTTDISGNYDMPQVPEGTFDIIASHAGYSSDTAYAFVLAQDTTLDFQLTLGPPGVPVLTYPPNSAILDTEYVDFNWNDVGGADRYVIEVARDISFWDIVERDSNLVVSGFTNVQPLQSGTYYWRVTSHNDNGYSPRSGAFVFTTYITMTAPLLQAPPDGYITDSSYINFDWSDVSRADHYIIEIATNSNFSSLVEFDSSLTTSSYRNVGALANGTYYWRVTGYNSYMYSPRSAPRSFTVNNLLAAPTLIAPEDGFLTDTAYVAFDWNDVTGAVSYVFEAATDSFFNTVIAVDSAVVGSSYGHSFSDATYYWRVTAFNGTQHSPRSLVRDFQVRTSLSAPNLLAPPDGFVADTNRVDFDWGDVPGATRYVFEAASDSNFANVMIVDSSRIASSYPQAGPFADGHYFWRVSATNGMIFSPRSSMRDFTVNTTAGVPAPLLLAPGDGYISSSAYIAFDWTDVPDTVYYLFELAGDPDFSNMVIVDSMVQPSSYTNSDSLSNGEFHWRVKATNGYTWSPYSEARTVIVDVTVDFIPGDANGNGQLNGLDVIYLVNYLKGGPPPMPYLAGDANGSCNVNGIDVTYLVTFFKGGAYPIRGDCTARVNLIRRPAENKE